MARKNHQQPLRVVHDHCAGIDIGSREHWVGVDPDRCDNPVRRFSTFTDDLLGLADWLESLEINVVAMEATGVYWIPLFEILDARGFDVYLVNSRATRQITGRKSDVLDCQWIWQLMSYGLLRGAFRPSDATCSMRSIVRQRANKVRDQAQALNRMQKALSQMNIQLANVISNIAGVTGMKILRAIIEGNATLESWPLIGIGASRLITKRLSAACEATGARSTCMPCPRKSLAMIFWKARSLSVIRRSCRRLNNCQRLTIRLNPRPKCCEAHIVAPWNRRLCIKRSGRSWALI